MKLNTPRLSIAILTGAALVAPATLTPSAQAEDRKAKSYHDKAHNDDHQWNSREDQAYRMWARENHRPETNFDRIPERDRQSYWGWRHDHSDSLLKIEIK
jgi:hypothetical protein